MYRNFQNDLLFDLKMDEIRREIDRVRASIRHLDSQTRKMREHHNWLCNLQERAYHAIRRLR